MLRILILTVGLSLAATGVARADLSLSGTAAARYNDNVGNAEDRDDKVADETLGARLGLYELISLDVPDTLTVGGDIAGEWFDHLTGLRNGSIDASLALRHKWALGLLAPWTRAALSIGRSDYDADYRNASWYRGSLAAGKRIDAALNVFVEYSHEHRSASPGEALAPGISADVFSGSANLVSVVAEYSLSDRISLNAAGFWRHGDVVVSTSSYYDSYDAARAVEEDPALGDEVYAYRFVGTSVGARLGGTVSLTTHSALTVSYQFTNTRAQGNSYHNGIPELRWDYRY